MSFTYPLGLLGFIGIPILIIIYIIKNKYTEQIIPTTYLWSLSEKFLKKKKPISLINGIISLLLQIGIVIVVSLLIAHPVITIPNSAKEYCFILDGSGSMNTIDNGLSRLEKGKNEIKELINSSTDGSYYTLVYVSDNSKVIYEKITSKDKASELMENIKPLGVTISYTDALKYAQDYFNENSSLLVYLITDKDYNTENINVINVSNSEKNFAIDNLNYTVDGLRLTINGNVNANCEEDVTIEIYVNDILETKLNLSLTSSQTNPFSFVSTTTDFASIKAVITTTDSLTLDNTKIIYNQEKNHDYSTLIISEHPFYLKSVIETIGNISVSTISFVEYETRGDTISGYSLYIFDSYTPINLPTDGTIWLFNPSVSIKGAGFSVQDEFTSEDGFKLSYPKNSTSLFKTLTNGLEKQEIIVSKYRKYGLNRNFTVLLTQDGNPVLFTGTSENGNREVVFAFDLHYSNMAMLMDYIILTKNLLTYSFPTIIENSEFICGDEVEINVLSNCKSIKIDSPNGNVSYLDVSKDITTFNVTEVGTYKLTLKLGDGDNATFKELLIFSSMPDEESSPSLEKTELSIQGEATNDYSNGIYDKLVILFTILIFIYIIDWMVYCYEQYQLR